MCMYGGPVSQGGVGIDRAGKHLGVASEAEDHQCRASKAEDFQGKAGRAENYQGEAGDQMFFFQMVELEMTVELLELKMMVEPTGSTESLETASMAIQKMASLAVIG